jgi:hypothetical protein
MLPLHFEAKTNHWSIPRFDAFGTQLQAHISRIRHISISGKPQNVIEQLVSPAPALISLSLRDSDHEHIDSFTQYTVPDSLFDGNAPKLTHLELIGCDITWKSPLLKCLKTLTMLTPCVLTMPTLEDWLAALNGMSQLETLILHTATPAVSIDTLISGPQRTVTLPSLTGLYIAASAKACAFALAHLVLPILSSLHVICESHSSDGDDARILIPHVARHVHVLHGRAPLQTILFNGEAMHAEVVAWTVSDASVEFYGSLDLDKAAEFGPLVLAVTPGRRWLEGTDTVVFDAMLSHIPLDSISTLSSQNNTRLSKEVWLSHAPKLTMLKRVLLVPTAVRTFIQMLEEDAPPDGPPRLPQLTKLILSKVALTTLRTYHLRNMLVKRKEQGAPLEALDLRSCIGTTRAFQLLSETIGNVQVPAETPQAGPSAFFNWVGRVDPFDEEEERTDDGEDDDGPGPW